MDKRRITEDVDRTNDYRSKRERRHLKIVKFKKKLLKRKIENLISKHWEWAKDRIDNDGVKYSDKYPKEEHEKFIKKWIDNMGFEDIETRLLYAIKTGEMLHVV